MVELWHNIQWLVWLLAGVFSAGLVGHFLIFILLNKLAKCSKNKFNESFVKHCVRPLIWIGVLIIFRWLLPLTAGEIYIEKTAHVFSLFFITIFSWFLIKLVCVLEDYILYKYDISASDNFKARKIHTQLVVLKRIVVVVVLVLAFGTTLMSFEKIRQLGAAILASAGIIGIVIGIAAQKTIGTFIAGLQIAFTQPIRIDDVVVVENEWGRIEEITLTYVVVRIWDLRRLVVPINYFIEKSFQNWMRSASELLGTVFIYADYSLPIDEVRKQLNVLLKASDLWDGKVCSLQVTNSTDKAVELRATLSASDSSKL
jgi:small-conductance mechanosensitive channel